MNTMTLTDADFAALEQRIFERMTGRSAKEFGTRPYTQFNVIPSPAAVHVGHGRIVRVGQIWRSNDPRELRAVRILDIPPDATPESKAFVQNVVTGKTSSITLRNFTIGTRGWSLEREA